MIFFPLVAEHHICGVQREMCDEFTEFVPAWREVTLL